MRKLAGAEGRHSLSTVCLVLINFKGATAQLTIDGMEGGSRGHEQPVKVLRRHILGQLGEDGGRPGRSQHRERVRSEEREGEGRVAAWCEV